MSVFFTTDIHFGHAGILKFWREVASYMQSKAYQAVDYHKVKESNANLKN